MCVIGMIDISNAEVDIITSFLKVFSKKYLDERKTSRDPS
jgi:hypothetical protein